VLFGDDESYQRLFLRRAKSSPCAAKELICRSDPKHMLPTCLGCDLCGLFLTGAQPRSFFFLYQLYYCLFLVNLDDLKLSMRFSCSSSAFRDDDSYQRLFLRMSQELSQCCTKTDLPFWSKALALVSSFVSKPSGFNSWSNEKVVVRCFRICAERVWHLILHATL